MSSRRRVGVSAVTESARRQLMQPVQCWERVWVVPDVVVATTSSSTLLHVPKWVKTTKVQQFSDDEGTADEPLAPLPDEVEVVDGDDEEGEDKDDKDDNNLASQAPSRPPEMVEDSKPPSPKPQLVMHDDESRDALDASLNNMEGNMDAGVGVGLDADTGGLMDISSLAPDGLGLESAHDLSQMDPGDALLGGPLQMDESADPFAQT
ncbi:hypothetical protein MKEN_01259800 [Mycena kentingensis (nom. inval.)]|nr:hypothetical protein MKEN_01259800 [Mycena kentingensis (nom. inval.)]